MTHPLALLSASALVAVGRFLVTPTWPCALVALGSLALVALLERSGHAASEDVARSIASLRADVKAERELDTRVLLGEVKSLQERVVEAHSVALDAWARTERLEANRALGG